MLQKAIPIGASPWESLVTRIHLGSPLPEANYARTKGHASCCNISTQHPGTGHIAHAYMLPVICCYLAVHAHKVFHTQDSRRTNKPLLVTSLPKVTPRADDSALSHRCGAQKLASHLWHAADACVSPEQRPKLLWLSDAEPGRHGICHSERGQVS